MKISPSSRSLIDPRKKLTPVYLGDDQTDEDGFLALKDRGVTVLVSERRRKSNAKFFLKNVTEVKKFLRELTNETRLSKGPN